MGEERRRNESAAPKYNAGGGRRVTFPIEKAGASSAVQVPPQKHSASQPVCGGNGGRWIQEEDQPHLPNLAPS